MSSAGVDQSKVSGNIFDIGVLRRMIHFLRPYRWHFFGVLGLTLMLSVLVPLRPYLIQYTLDTYLVSGETKKIEEMTILLLILLLLHVVVQYFYLFYAGRLGQQVICDIRIRLYTHVQRLSLRFFNRTPIGQLVTRCVSDIETLLNVFSEGLASIFGDLLQLIALLVLMLVLDWRLALVILSTLPLLILSTYVFKEKIKSSFNQVRIAVARLNTFVQEHITGMYVVQVFGVEDSKMRQFRHINAQHRHAYMRSILYYSIYFPIAEVIYAASIGLLVWYGAGEVVQERLTLGVLVAFIMYVQMFFRPIRMIADKFNTLQMGIVSAHRIFQLLSYESSIPDTGNRSAQAIRGEVCFDRVYFAYEAQNYVLQDISISVSSGQMLALVGETGSGKTSTVHLLSRLYDPQRGQITIDGNDIQSYRLSELRAQVGCVLQDVFLFSGSLRENITLYEDSIDDTHIRDIAEKIGAWSLIDQLPGGLDYQVMERGATLSVGERQMISFLRAMVYDPRILILDEATSSVDSKSEALIQQAMFELMKGRTTLVVAHRLSTIQHADQIIVLSQGRIVEQGRHQELLSQRGTYYKLYQMQYKDQFQPTEPPMKYNKRPPHTARRSDHRTIPRPDRRTG